MQEFTAPVATSYKVQCWGASGGNSYIGRDYQNNATQCTNTVYGGKGGYCSGYVIFSSNLNVYIYVGQSGEETIERTFNGGGYANTFYGAFSGGGATDLRLTGGVWNDFGSLKSRIIVAAGGGGAQHYAEGFAGGNAGGLSGQDGAYSYWPSTSYSPSTVATGATQSSGGENGISTSHSSTNYTGGFGFGGYCEKNTSGGGGSGSGYYGGGQGCAGAGVIGSGSGGSSFISGYPGCDAISGTSTENNIIHTGQPNHYSGYIFTNPVMIDGGSVMPSPSGGTEIGHEGDGFCIITWQQLPQ